MNPLIRQKQIPFARPLIGPEEEEAVLRVMRSGWLTTGPETQAFEQEFADYIGSRHALAVNSATAGLHLCLEAIGLSKDDLVITSSFTFAATAEVIRYLGAHPVFVDIEKNSFNLCPYEVEEALKVYGRRVKAIIPVHIGGLLCDMVALREISQKFDIPLIEDAAHAFPVKSESGFGGNLGAAGVFSFYATKTITTGEGGMITTNSDKIAERAKTMRLHGISRLSWDRYCSVKSSWAYEVIEPGFKYNMPDILAAIGRIQLNKAAALKSERKKLAECYLNHLSDTRGLIMPPSDETGDHAWHLFSLRLDESKLNITRDQLIDQLQNAGIGTSVHFIPLHLMPYYKKSYNLKANDLPRTMKAFHQIVSLPLYPGLSKDDQERIINKIKDLCRKNMK